MISRLAPIALILTLLSACAGLAPRPATVDLQILALNDFHGNLETPGAAPGQPRTGGAAHLASLIKQRRAPQNSIMVAAGDLVGASPLLSSLFHDEPTVESLSAMGLALSAVGNHEFDEGPAELRRMQAGGCHPVDGCKGPQAFKGAGYRYLSAGVVDGATGETVFPPYTVRAFNGVRVGFIGMTTVETPAFVAPSGTAGLTFADEAQTINALVPQLRAQGIEAIVVLLHEGGDPSPGLNGCPVSGRIAQIIPKLDKAVDLIVSGHTNQAYVCTIDGRLVTSAWSLGRMLTDIRLTLDRRTGDVATARAENITVDAAALLEDAAQAALVGRYRALAAPLMTRVVGTASAVLTAQGNQARESVLGDIVAYAMRAAAAQATGQAIDLALMNSGGLRGQIAPGADGSVTYNDLFTVQPFGNTLVVMTLTGAQLEALLAEQFMLSEPNVLQVSGELTYAWRMGSGLVRESVRLNGRALDPAASYRIVTNNFLAEGGEGFSGFKAGTNPVPVGGDSEALEAWFKAHSPLGPTARDRIRLEH